MENKLCFDLGARSIQYRQYCLQDHHFHLFVKKRKKKAIRNGSWRRNSLSEKVFLFFSELTTQFYNFFGHSPDYRRCPDCGFSTQEFDGLEAGFKVYEGGRLEVTCSEGYTVTGQTSIYCINGQWDRWGSRAANGEHNMTIQYR